MWVDPIIIVWGRVTSCYNDSREYSCSLPQLNHVTIRPPQYVMRTSMLFMVTCPVRSVLSDDHVSADMRTPFFHTVSSAICLPDLHDQIDINWAHGVVVSHPLRMRKALGTNPSVSMHMCTHDSDGSPAYDVVCIHAYMPRDLAHELVWPNGYGAALLRRAPRSLRRDCGFESRLTYLLRMASILTDILMLTSLPLSARMQGVSHRRWNKASA